MSKPVGDSKFRVVSYIPTKERQANSFRPHPADWYRSFPRRPPPSPLPRLRENPTPATPCRIVLLRSQGASLRSRSPPFTRHLKVPYLIHSSVPEPPEFKHPLQDSNERAPPCAHSSAQTQEATGQSGCVLLKSDWLDYSSTALGGARALALMLTPMLTQTQFGCVACPTRQVPGTCGEWAVETGANWLAGVSAVLIMFTFFYFA